MPAIKLISFGYLHLKDGRPPAADRVEDVRNRLRDPAAAGDVLDLDGRDPRVQDIVLNTPGARELLDNLVDYASLAAGPAVIATGCAGGKHRAAAITELLGRELRERGFDVVIQHRHAHLPRVEQAGGPSRHVAEALCMTYDADWETIAKKLGGQLRNREVADTGEYDTLLVVPAPPDTPKIACLCGSTRYYDQFQQAYYDLTMRGEIVLSVGFYPHSKAKHGHGEGVGHDSAEKTGLDELHKRKIDLADYILVVSDEAGYFGDSTKDEIRYALEHRKPVRFAHPAAATRASELRLTAAGER